MAQEMSPALYAAHVGIPVSTVDAWITGRGSVLFDARDIRQIHGRLALIAVQAPNAAGEGARPRFVENTAYKYERKRKSVHKAAGAGAVEVIPVEGAGVPGMTQPAPEDVEGYAPLGMIGRKGVAQGLQVSNRETGTLHA